MKKINLIKSTDKSGVFGFGIIKSIGFTLFVTLILLLCQAMVFNHWKIPEEKLLYATYTIYYFSFLLCGFFAGVFNRKNGWKSGLLSGIIYACVLFVFGFFDGISFELSDLLRVLISLLCSLCGGVLGINYTYTRKIKKRRRHK